MGRIASRSRGGLAQQLVAAFKAEALVDQAEAVEVHVQHAHLPPSPLGPVDGVVYVGGEALLIEQAGQSVVPAQVLDALA